MQNEPFNHKVADVIHQSWPFLAIMGTVFVTSLKLWWGDRRNIKNEISEVRKLNLWLKENAATHDDLTRCREEVRQVDDKNLTIIFNELKDMRKHDDTMAKQNADEHRELMNHIIKLAGNGR